MIVLILSQLSQHRSISWYIRLMIEGIVEYTAIGITRRLAFHPLSSYPGPLVAACQYLRFAPNRISINSAEASRDLHSVNANTVKSDVYGAFKRFFGSEMSLTTVDHKIHAFRPQDPCLQTTSQWRRIDPSSGERDGRPVTLFQSSFARVSLNLITLTKAVEPRKTKSNKMSRQNVTFYLAERPAHDIVPHKTFEARSELAPTPDDLKDRQALVETLYLSLDPSMRARLNGVDDIFSVLDTKSYMAPMTIGQKMVGGAISRVLASKSTKVQPGDLVHTFSGWTEVSIVPDDAIDVMEMPENVKLTYMLMAARDGPGPSAYTGLTTIAKVKSGDTVLVSAASGATGSIVGQIAKIYGARVVGITGSDEKCAWLCSELGFDAAVNWRSSSFAEDLKAATPDGFDIYWDNMGGRVLDVALDAAKSQCRFLVCGEVSQYNLPFNEHWEVKNVHQIAKKQLHLEGFAIQDHVQDLPHIRRQLFKWVQEGKLKIEETIVEGGINLVESTFTKLFEGDKRGKLILQVKAT
ncbi:Uu.00g130880.m01.CDS01 [Anthostomella pinea]|uniref:Dehydrogenase FUB6 n=1 Tax=Anthostomella pinea TaxID=933095 RepID=A0AAI8VJW4_9PEZI|nr:Uu.00g130880.m01.CDS01 [Anthostomella pinea]